jgi:hypothetical protein
MPRSWAVVMMRTAISPRLAMSNLFMVGATQQRR